MDTSPEYIKQCDCPEIRDSIIKCDTIPNIYAYQPCPPYYEGEEIGYEIGDFYELRNLERDNPYKIVWLPRQDQIQDMLFAEDLLNGDIGYVVHRLWYFENKGGYNSSSMQQLWLAFYMKEKHNKTWSGKEWI